MGNGREGRKVEGKGGRGRIRGRGNLLHEAEGVDAPVVGLYAR